MPCKKKVEFVKNTFPDLSKINPFTDYKAVETVKKSLIENKFYVVKSIHNCHETAIINIILAAQGKKVSNRTRASKSNA